MICSVPGLIIGISYKHTLAKAVIHGQLQDFYIVRDCFKEIIFVIPVRRECGGYINMGMYHAPAIFGRVQAMIHITGNEGETIKPGIACGQRRVGLTGPERIVPVPFIFLCTVYRRIR